MTLQFRTIRESADGMSRVAQRSDGTYWAQRIYVDSDGVRRWEVAPIEPEVADPVLHYPARTPLWRRILRLP